MLEHRQEQQRISKVKIINKINQTPEQRAYAERLAREQGVVPIAGKDLFPAEPLVDHEEAVAFMELLYRTRKEERTRIKASLKK